VKYANTAEEQQFKGLYLPFRVDLPPVVRTLYDKVQKLERYCFLRPSKFLFIACGAHVDAFPLHFVVSLALIGSPFLLPSANLLLHNIARQKPFCDFQQMLRYSFSNRYFLKSCLTHHWISASDVKTIFAELLTKPRILITHAGLDRNQSG
jgi:hypothetical protein